MSQGKNKGKNQKQPPIRYGKKDQPKNSVVATAVTKVAQQATTHANKDQCQDVVIRALPKEPETPLDFTQPITLQFSAVDTLFFRETRPMESQGELQSVFPPSVRTLAGAVRSWIGEYTNVDWHDFEKKNKAHQKDNSQPPHELRKIIGFGDYLGGLKFQGAWLNLNGQRLYPAPLNLMKTKKDELFS